jgi:hypothetical protein
MYLLKIIINICFVSLDVYDFDGPNVNAVSCNRQSTQKWKWNSADGTVRSQHNGECLTVQADIEVWAGPLNDGSQAVLLLNRGSTSGEAITVKWTDIGFPADKAAAVRDLWAHKDLGTFTGSFTSPNLDTHSVMMLKVTPNK